MAVEDPTLSNPPAGTPAGQKSQEPQEPMQPAEPQIDWEGDDNPYKQRYMDSQSQVQPLVQQLHQYADFDQGTRSWKPKAPTPEVKEPDDFEKTMEGYDPDFKKAVGGYVNSQVKNAFSKFQEEAAFVQNYNSSVLSGRSKAMEEFGDEFEFVKNGKMNPISPLYKLADEIVVNKYADFNPDGTFNRYATPEAEYLAIVEAYAILAKRAKQAPPDKDKLSAIQGKGTKQAASKKELSYDEYNKLSTDEKDAYDSAQMSGQANT